MKTSLRLLALVVLIVGVYGGPSRFREPDASSRLESIQALAAESDTCQWETAAPDHAAARVPEGTFFDAIGPASVYAAADEPASRLMAPPIRKIRDTYPIYSSVAVDLQHDEVVLQDNNLWSTKIFNRLDNTPPHVEFQQPKRVIEGEHTEIQYNNGLYIDQANGDIYSIESDTGDSVVVFSHSAQGDALPARELVTPHRGYALGMDEDRGELFASVEYPPKVAVYAKLATGRAAPLRVIEGDATKLYAAHGLALDVQRKLLFVNNWGNESNFKRMTQGIALDPLHKEVFIVDARNNLLTFSFPELF